VHWTDRSVRSVGIDSATHVRFRSETLWVAAEVKNLLCKVSSSGLILGAGGSRPVPLPGHGEGPAPQLGGPTDPSADSSWRGIGVRGGDLTLLPARGGNNGAGRMDVR